MDFHATLMRHAVSPGDPTVLALAGVLSGAFDQYGAHVLPIPGLDASKTRWLLSRWFPGGDAALPFAWEGMDGTSRCRSRYDEVEDLVTLFKDHADPDAGTAEEAECIAHALAGACLGTNHLWQDLQLPSRRELSALLGYWFPRLAAKNTHDMKWKKFFYKQLCEREGLFVCKAPSCGVCSDYAHCFGPE
ncbi:nitrogen fixation protein NifQ [Paraburkholderia unamae]|uniref:Nitrogen fixation protein NifQ n=1 Tax=Paraburkholderia unamae TaxID=219649 RepID=A0ABX5KU81_9BURK|nr:nitrogen fixation protein NifQ [Paraburkholderia unamae]PVX85448.1 nitrogen fixation protein NifQ [Paraburkholderia unamae]RAR55341.1 nitrogen fixation protein NifQ [Paraburkholderia unamae]CAG9267785.1 Nitrogenase FeMo-cofactor synthesis molybdenum delivery protein NifQ [Paraburkholderia unamae]